MIYDIPQDCSWFPFSDEPLLTGNIAIPKWSDPYVIMPERSCDNKWHMFVHSWIGIHHFVSTSGIAWDHGRVVIYNAHSPFVYRENEKFYLVYEKHDKDSSKIEMITSTNLETWSRPRSLLDGKEIPFAKDYISSSRLSHPQLFKFDGKYRLYFGASHIVLPQTKLKIARYFSCAESDSLSNSFTLIRTDKPLLEADPDDKWTNLGCGSIKLIDCKDSFYAFQCGVYWDEKDKQTHGAMTILKSSDGINFEKARKEPILVPSEKGWTKGYITSCDVHYREEEKCWYCYFGANDSESPVSKESVGLMIGSIPQTAKAIGSKVRGIFLKLNAPFGKGL